MRDRHDSASASRKTRRAGRPRPHSTIKDVARLAGVSIATVSHVVNATRVVREGTAQQVLDAMRALRYSPDINARSLRNKKTKTVGMVVADISNQFFPQLANSIESVLGQEGYSIIIANSGGEVENERKLLTLLAGRRVDGLILVPAANESGHLANLSAQGIPIVLVDRKLPGVHLDSVTVDNGPATRAVTELLLQAGHSRIAIISGRLSSSASSERVDGYLDALNSAGITRSQELIRIGGFDLRTGYDETVSLMGLGKPPTAIVACNNPIGQGAMRALHQSGVWPSSDVELAIWEEAPWMEFLDPPPFAVVCQPIAKLGESAGRRLIHRMKDRTGEEKSLQLNVSIRRRVSETFLVEGRALERWSVKLG